MAQREENRPVPSLLPWIEGGYNEAATDPAPEPYGFHDPMQASRNLSRLGVGPRASWWQALDRYLSTALRDAADPDLALAAVQRLDEITEIPTAAADPSDLYRLVLILGSSPFLGDLLAGNPEWAGWLLGSGGIAIPSDEGIGALDLPRSAGGEDPDSVLSVLNLIRRREQLRIGSRAVLGLSTIEEEYRALSDLADAVLGALFDLLWPADLPSPAVIGVGKLGGRELNFSSDIDLIYILPVAGITDLAATLPNVTRAVQEQLEALTRYTPDGSLYRVDLRLRPGGERAPLIRSHRWMETYYASRGEPWERQMLVKARACAGDMETGERFIELIQPFLYPSHSDTDPREEAHRLRRERRAREGIARATGNVKLAPGAIRDIEFVVQVLQLLYGGRQPAVRHPSTLEAVGRLRIAGVLPTADSEALTDAYRFMRRLEHYLQMQEDRQTFTIPEVPHRRRAIARLMGFGNPDELQKRYDAHRDSVHSALLALLPGIGEEESGEPVESLLNLPPGGEEASRRLLERGFLRPEQSHRVLLATGSGVRAGGANAWAAFVGLLPPLLKDAVETGAPDRALNNLERILRRMGSVGAYARLLAREAPVRRALLALCASGDMLTELLLRHPEHFERLFSLGAAGSAAERSEWVKRLRAVRRSSESSRVLASELESLRTREFLATGLAHVMGEIDLPSAMARLGGLARDLLRCFFGFHFREHLSPPRVTVLSMGTLSASAMTFASDADLLFIHGEGAGVEIQTLAARCAGLLSPPGGPYPVDMRLRPEGRSAPTSVDSEYLRTYLSERASPWEALALSRISLLYGRKGMSGGAIEIIEEWLEGFRLDEATRHHLLEVRERQLDEVRRESAESGETSVDVKRSAGCMSDIEYITLGLTLDRWHRSLPRPAHIPDLIPSLIASGSLAAEEGELLSRFYLRLRGIQVGLQLLFGRDINRLPDAWPDGIAPVTLPGETASGVAGAAERVREIFERAFTL